MRESSLNLEDPDARYLSCRFIEGELYLFHDFVRFCCVGDHDGLNAPRIQATASGLPEAALVEQVRRSLREANNGSDPPCAGCAFLERDSWNRLRERQLLHAVGVATSLGCNLDCDYCSQVDQPGHRSRATPSRYGPVIEEIIRHGRLSKRGRITLGGGEPVLVPDFEEALRTLCAYGIRVSVLTNATVLSMALRDLLASPAPVRVLTSLDAGTPDLYKTIKGKDLFLRALTNLGTYARTGGHVTAKYIISSNNTDQREFTEFARHLRREGIRRAAISLNTNPATQFPASGPDSPLEAMSRLRAVLWRQDIRVHVMDFGLKQRRLRLSRRGFGRMLMRLSGML